MSDDQQELLQRLGAIEEIKQLKARYFRCMDTAPVGRVGQVFATDCVMEVPEADMVNRGRDEIVRTVSGALKGATHHAPRAHARDRDHRARAPPAASGRCSTTSSGPRRVGRPGRPAGLRPLHRGVHARRTGSGASAARASSGCGSTRCERSAAAGAPEPVRGERAPDRPGGDRGRHRPRHHVRRAGGALEPGRAPARGRSASGTGDHLALVLDNRAEFFEVVWGAMRAGLYVTPINWHLIAGRDRVHRARLRRDGGVRVDRA